MPTNLTDVDEFTTGIGPIGTDYRNSASVRDSLQPQTNRTRYLYNRINPLADLAALKAVSTSGMTTGTGRMVIGHGYFTFNSTSSATPEDPWVVRPDDRPVSDGRWFAAAPHKATRIVRVPIGACATGERLDENGDLATMVAADTVAFDASITMGKRDLGDLKITSKSTSNRHWFCVPLDLPDGCSITQVSALIKPATHSSLPANMPFIGLVKTGIIGATRGALVDSIATDASASVGAYNTAHSITFTPSTPQSLDRGDRRYELVVGAAGGANTVLGDFWRWVEVTMTVNDARGW